MTPVAKPLPDLDDPIAGAFWRNAAADRLTFQRCPACGYFRWPPAPVCPECLASGGDWTDVPPTGTIWSFAIYHHVYDRAFRADAPYNVALVELDAGPRLITNIAGLPHDRLAIGQRVTAVFEEAAPGIKLVKFRVVGG